MKCESERISKRLLAKGYFACLLYVLFNIALGVVIVVLALLLLPFPNLRRGVVSRAVMWASRGLLHGIIEPLSLAVFNKPEGLENVPDGGAVLVSNHKSLIDPIVLLAYVPNATVVLKGKYSKWLVVWLLVKLQGFVVLDADNPVSVENALRRCRAALQRGGNLIIFPEGARFVGDRLGEFKMLAFRLAYKMKLPTVCACVCANKPFLYKSDGVTPRKGVVFTTKFFEPLYAADFQDAAQLRARAERIITKYVSSRANGRQKK